MSGLNERLAERLNVTLRQLFDRYDNLYLLGEDVADPYGGAFRITRHLSTAHPDRVLSTPISESGILGVAGGLALCGNRVIVEVMFGDFIALGFDQIVNFATKSVTMYGQWRPMQLIVRCPVGGHRGYGPTHSQSLQKHFIGVPNLALYELSAFHDPEWIFDEAFGRGEPAIVFEHKILYGQRVYRDGVVDDGLRYDFADAGRNWARVRPAQERAGAPRLVVVTPGGTADAALAAARAVLAERGADVRVLVPARLYPLDIEPVLDLMRGAAGVCVAEESTEGGTWGTEVARRIHERLWGALPRPVTLLNSRDSIIPAAPHLERSVLLQASEIESALRVLLPPALAAGLSQSSAPEVTEVPGAAGVPLAVPKLNNNDDRYLVLAWLAGDGATVDIDDPVVEIETSKAVEVLGAPEHGVLRHALAEGSQCRPGGHIGRVLPIGAGSGDVKPAGPGPGPALPAGPSAGPVELDRRQLQVAAVVSRSHQEIPSAFALRRVRLDAVDKLALDLADQDCEPVGLLELVVRIVAEQRAAFPLCFATPAGDGRVRVYDHSHVGVTMDAGRGLFIPVVRDADRRSLADIADELAGFRMRAFRGTFSEQHLRDAAITVSWNHDQDVVAVGPIVLPDTACSLSVGGPLDEVRVDAGGKLLAGRVTNIGLAHDHRIVNGRDAVAFLDAVASALQDSSVLAALTAHQAL